MSKLEKVTTRDGSTSFMNTEVGETYHSMSGAANEALFKHVQPSNLIEKEHVSIADVCFGLGYNTFVAIAKHQEKNPNGALQVFAFENDMDILSQINELNFGEYKEQAQYVQELLKNKIESTTDYDLFLYENDFLTITLYVGDLKKTIIQLADEAVDVIFFDPFSPKKQPDLWSEDIFSQMYRILEQGGILTTYSCARVTRTNMLAAGFKVEDGPVVGRVSPGTLGYK